jgi:hypothetical protein
MKKRMIGLFAGWAMVGCAAAQMVLPGGTKNPGNRSIGGSVNGGVDGGATINRKESQPAKRYTTHIVLSESRIWRNADGRTLEGKLLAFEDVVVEVPAGGAEPPAPVPPADPTVVRNGKVRMQVGKKIFEVALTSLAKVDQDYVEGIRAGLAKKKSLRP